VKRHTPPNLAAVGYQAYGEWAGWKNYQGRPMPTWDELPDPQRHAWEAAAWAIARRVNNESAGDGYLGPPATLASMPRLPDGPGPGSEPGQPVPALPTVGRIVHYVSPSGGCWAAVVTAVLSSPPNEPWLAPVALHVWYPPRAPEMRSDDLTRVLHDEGITTAGRTGAAGTWHWPERSLP
jgi:hypothetical protein